MMPPTMTLGSAASGWWMLLSPTWAHDLPSSSGLLVPTHQVSTADRNRRRIDTVLDSSSLSQHQQYRRDLPTLATRCKSRCATTVCYLVQVSALCVRRHCLAPAASSMSHHAAAVVFGTPPSVTSPAMLALRADSADGAPYLNGTRPFSDRGSRPGYRARATTTLLVNGCGRSGTHALTALLRRHGVLALHEGHGKEATVGWPYVGRLDGSWHEFWPMSNQPHGGDAHDPIFKVHRHPLSAIKSIAGGFTSSGACRNPSERRWDARAWHAATRFVPLPIGRAAIDAQETCAIGRAERMRLALHYWVKWNLLADRWSAHAFAVETMTATEILQRWCAHCARVKTCVCPASAELALLSSGNQSDGTDTSLEQRRRHLVNQLSEPWQKQKQQELMAARSASGDQRVRRRKGHGKRKGPPITWDVLRTIDPNMTRVAILLAKEYGYSLVEPRLASATVQLSA